MAVSDRVVGNMTTIYIAIIVAMKAYGLMMGQSYTGIFVLVMSTVVVGLVLVATLTWDVSRKSKKVHVVPSNAIRSRETCRGGICWHGVAVKSPASQLWFRLPQHHPFAPGCTTGSAWSFNSSYQRRDQSRFQSLADSVRLVDNGPLEEIYEFESELEYEDSDDHLTLASRWYDGFINKDILISYKVYSVDIVEFDRQELRRLVRNVHSIQDRHKEGDEDPGGKRDLAAATKSLNRFLVSLAKRLSSSP